MSNIKYGECSPSIRLKSHKSIMAENEIRSVAENYVRRKNIEEEFRSNDLFYDDEKFILKDDIDITIESAHDVLKDKKYLTQVKSKKKNLPSIAPYRIRRKYIPMNIIGDEDTKCDKKDIAKPLLKPKVNHKMPSGKRKTHGGSATSRKSTTTLNNYYSNHGNSSLHSAENFTVTDSHDNGSIIYNKGNDSNKEYKGLPILEIINKVRLEITVEEKCIVPWSGQEVMLYQNLDHPELCTGYLSRIRTWKNNWRGSYEKFHFAVKSFVKSTPVFIVLTLCGITNTIFLAMNRYDQPAYEAAIGKKVGTVFTYVYFVEIFLKLFSFGVVKFFFDPMNCINTLVSILNLLEMVFWSSPGSNSFSRSFQSFSTLRIFKVMRMLRLLKPMRSMKLLIAVISDAIFTFVYVGILLLLFLLIYSLFGMQIFGGRFYFPEGRPRQNYDSFFNAFLSVYQVLTMQNWQEVLYSSMRAQNNLLVFIFYITWIIIGNYILLNLFLAFMLNMFTENDNDDDDFKDDESAGTIDQSSVSNDISEPRNRRIRHNGFTHPKLINIDAPKKNFSKFKKNSIITSDCYYSLYLFSKTNRFRIFCWKFVRNNKFEWGILGLVTLSTILLAVDTFYLINPDPLERKILVIINGFLAFCFTIEVVLKIVAYGLLFENCTYFHDSWNIIDFVVLMFSFMDIFLSFTNLRMFRVLRLLKIFRPLKYLSSNNHIKMIIKALIKSFGALCNALILILIIFIMFSIVGVHFFSGKFQYCTISKYENTNKELCINNGGIWKTYNENFDNVLNGLIHLFGITIQENWVIPMYQAIDCTSVDSGPQLDSGWYYAFYYIIFIFIGPMFLLNIFVGIMFYNFKKAYKDELGSIKGIPLTPEQIDWFEIQKLILIAEPDYQLLRNKMTNPLRILIHSLITNFYFELTITIALFINMILLATVSDTEFGNCPLYISIIDYILLVIYTVEIILKLIGFGSIYWYDPWNIFEFLNIIFNYIDIILTFFNSDSIAVLKVISRLMRIIRVLRVTRVFRLLRKLRNLQTIIEIVQICLPSVINVFFLMAFIFFIYAILGCYLFYDVPYGAAINDVYNFHNFGQAIVVCLKLTSGEDWNIMMYECARMADNCVPGIGCGNWYAYVYFISFRIIVSFVMLNLFVLVVLHFFDKYFVPDTNNVVLYKEDYDVFKDRWIKAKPEFWGNFLKTNKLVPFFKSLPPRFGFEADDPNVLGKQIAELKIV